jgi:hypothetical protein
MSATGAEPRSERTPLRRESRTWGLIRRTLPRGRSMGSLFYLISVGLIAGWIIAVFFGFGLFFLMPRSAKLASGLSPGGTSFEASLPLTQQPTTRLDRLSDLPPPAPAHPMGDAAADKDRPAVGPPSLITAKVNPLSAPVEKTIAHIIDEPPGQALTVGLGTISAATGEAAPPPAPPTRLSTAPEPRGASQSPHSRSSRKPLERRPSNTRTAQPRAPMSAIHDVLHKHSRLLK